MPAQIAEVIAQPFTAWVATVGTAFPALLTPESGFTTGASGWTKIGKSGNKNYSEAGVTVTHTQAHGQFVSAGGIVPRKKWRTEEGMTVAFELVDLSPASYALIMDKATVTTVTGASGEQSLPLKRGLGTVGENQLAFYSLLLRGVSTLNEEKTAQYEITACCQSGNFSPKFSQKQGPAMLALQFDVLELEEGKWAVYRAGS